MNVQRQYLPVNWIDGMKINKDHFIHQDNACDEAMQEIASRSLSPIRYGLLPSVHGESTFNIKISLDNQNALRVSLLSCQAVTRGGAHISIPALSANGAQDTSNLVNATLPFTPGQNEAGYWLFLLVHPFEKQPAGHPDLNENPPRLPFLLPSYALQLVSDHEYRNYANHPYAMPVGKLSINGAEAHIDKNYLPPCLSVIAHPDLLSLLGELDKFLADVELFCSRIVQKIFVRKQQNELSELVMFLCDRVILYVAEALTVLRFKMIYESPVEMFRCVASFARIMKNTMDLRTGSGKDELMAYLAEWCDLKPGEFETIMTAVANNIYNHNDVNKTLAQVTAFVSATTHLFETLSGLEFIGKKKESGTFVKEETARHADSNGKSKRRFFA